VLSASSDVGTKNGKYMAKNLMFKVTSNLHGSPPEKNLYTHCFEGNPKNYISIERL